MSLTTLFTGGVMIVVGLLIAMGLYDAPRVLIAVTFVCFGVVVVLGEGAE